MTAKRFGALDLAATTDTVLMSGATGYSTTVNVRFTNRNAAAITVRLALVDADGAGALGALADEDYLEYDTPIVAKGVLENTGIAIPEDYSLVVYSDTANVSVVAFGFEEQNI